MHAASRTSPGVISLRPGGTVGLSSVRRAMVGLAAPWRAAVWASGATPAAPRRTVPLLSGAARGGRLRAGDGSGPRLGSDIPRRSAKLRLCRSGANSGRDLDMTAFSSTFCGGFGTYIIVSIIIYFISELLDQFAICYRIQWKLG